MKKMILTLCVIQQDGMVLLGMKKRGYAAGRWNGYGGKLNEGESVEQGMLRELKEESELVAKDYEKAAILTFHSQVEDYISEVHVYRIRSYEGEPVETEEMLPRWFALDEIPYGEMWPDDIHWLPRVLAGENLIGEFRFSDNDTIESYELKLWGENER